MERHVGEGEDAEHLGWEQGFGHDHHGMGRSQSAQRCWVGFQAPIRKTRPTAWKRRSSHAGIQDSEPNISPMSTRVRHLCLGAALAAAACTTSHHNDATRSPAPSTAVPSPTTAETARPADTQPPIMDDPGPYGFPNGGPDAMFDSPSGNIRCVFSSANDFAYVDCAINARRWARPICPSREVAHISVGPTKREPTTVRCEGFPDALAVRALPYGHGLRDMQVTCVSRPTGVWCSNGTDGFTVNRERLTTF